MEEELEETEKKPERIGNRIQLYDDYYLDVRNLVRCFKGETLFQFGKATNSNTYNWVLGVGRVTNIMKGKDFDLVYINFGRKYSREIIVQENHSRRQLLTLKKGWLCWFRGKYKWAKVEDGQYHSIFYALGLQPWFVPMAADLKKMDIDETDYGKVEEEKETDYLNFIDEIHEDYEYKENK